MPEQPWVDHYETLQLHPSADREAIERIYRLLAKRYHPDNDATGDVDQFNQVRRAYEILSNEDSRASYDATYERERSEQWRVFRQESAGDDRTDDQRLFHAVLSLLYIQRRREPDKAGLAPTHLERILGVPREHLDFPLWYLKKKGYMEVLQTGLLAITVEGVDALGSGALSLPSDRLLTDSSAVRRGDEDDGGTRAIPERT